MEQISGLSSSEVLARRQKGQGNEVQLSTGRSYKDIVVTNAFNPVNGVLYAIGLAMIAIGQVGNALITASTAVLNAIIGTFQEVRAKRQLDKISVLARVKVSVLRDGREQQVDPAELVLGDVLVIRAGDQFQADGVVVGEGRFEVDESQLTGEADLIPKVAGDRVLSGTFCVTGSALVETTEVGSSSFANKLTANARQFQTTLTPLQREVNLIMRLIMVLVGFVGLVVILDLLIGNAPIELNLQISGIVVGMIPAGLLTSIVLTYAKGAVKIAQQGALVQQSNAVESLSNVTVLCTDKTGTLTANKIRFEDVYPVGLGKDDFKLILGDFAGSASATNKTSEALIEGLGGVRRRVTDEVPFSSARKWSAVACDDAGGGERPPMHGAYVMGALEMLNGALALDENTHRQVNDWSEQGQRVLVFGHAPNVLHLHDADGEPALPHLQLMGLISFSDELRPHLEEAMTSLTSNNVRLKVISGDNPQTVAALARQAGLPGDLSLVSGPDLAAMGAAEFGEAASRATVFGRITPEQKEALVDALRRQGEYVAMIGDGVNDVLSLKKAQLGIAMQSGSGATRGVADMVLLGDSFEALPPAFGEGQSIIKALRDIVNLFLSSVLPAALLAIAITALSLGFPFNVMQNAMISYIVRGIPPLVIAFLARPGRVKGSLLHSVLHFAVPATMATFVFGLVVYVVTFGLVMRQVVSADVTPEMIEGIKQFVSVPFDYSQPGVFEFQAAQLLAQSALTGFFILSGLALLIFLEPPRPWFAGGDEFSGDWRPTIMAVLLAIGYIVAVRIPFTRRLMAVAPLPPPVYVLMLALVVVWALILRQAWRHNWLERFLDLEITSG